VLRVCFSETYTAIRPKLAVLGRRYASAFERDRDVDAKWFAEREFTLVIGTFEKVLKGFSRACGPCVHNFNWYLEHDLKTIVQVGIA
jgi:hypothetical protein